MNLFGSKVKPDIASVETDDLIEELCKRQLDKDQKEVIQVLASTFEKKPNEVWIVGDPYTHGLHHLDVFWSKEAVMQHIKEIMHEDVDITTSPNGRSIYAREKGDGYFYTNGKNLDAHLFEIKEEDWRALRFYRSLGGQQ